MNPWDRYLTNGGPPFRVSLLLGGQLFDVVLTTPQGNVSKSDMAIIGSHELRTLRTASPNRPIPAKTAMALLRIKRIIGGEVTHAKVPKVRSAREPKSAPEQLQVEAPADDAVPDTTGAEKTSADD